MASQIRAIIFNSWINFLFLLVPAGFAVRYTKGASLTTFLVNFFAIIPLSAAAEMSIAELVLRIGKEWGGLVYITIRYEFNANNADLQVKLTLKATSFKLFRAYSFSGQTSWMFYKGI